MSIADHLTKNHFVQEKETQEADLLNNILNASINGVFACEAIRNEEGKIVDLRFIKVNKRFEELIGKTEKELMHQTFLTAFPAAQFLMEINSAVIETKKLIRKEVYYKGDGIDAWFDISLSALGENGLVVSFNDVTEDHRNKEKIESSLHYFQTVINSSQTGITVIEPIYKGSEIIDFRYKLVNETFSKMIEKQPQELRGQPLSKIFPLYKAQGIFDRYKQIYLTGEAQRFDLHYVKGGYDVWTDILAKKQGDEILVTFHDYTSLKLGQLKLEAMMKDLKRSNANLEDFAYAASHDLQEPLRKIHFFADKLKNRYADLYDEEGINLFRRMESATHRMRDLIDDLLAYSQIGLKPQEYEEVKLDKVVQEAISDLEAMIEEKKAHFTIDPLPVVKGDTPQLRQLFQNLISNSLKYAHSERIPFVSIRSKKISGREAGLLLPSEKLNEDFYAIDITDNGIGFDQEHAEKIFNVFQRLHSRNEYAGTGVGLAIVKKVIDNHNGYISASGVAGHGATFTILLPASLD